jgi:hypothetical protein
MNTRCWLIIKDDEKRTFEVCGQTTNDNSFTNAIYAMQKAGMHVSGLTPPVTITTASKDVIKITGYVKEDGLHNRLTNKHREITTHAFDDEHDDWQ